MNVKFLSGLLILAAFFSPLAQAEEIEIKVIKIASELYKLEGKSILLQTHNCDDPEHSQDAFLKMNDSSKKIVFRESKSSCDVVAAYKLSAGGVGSYSVVIQYERENWYAISSTKSYVRTKQCLNISERKRAVLSLSGTGFGTLHIGRTECQVEGVYTKLD